MFADQIRRQVFVFPPAKFCQSDGSVDVVKSHDTSSGFQDPGAGADIDSVGNIGTDDHGVGIANGFFEAAGSSLRFW